MLEHDKWLIVKNRPDLGASRRYLEGEGIIDYRSSTEVTTPGSSCGQKKIY